jgi:phosphoribosylformylglycinamidine synthase
MVGLVDDISHVTKATFGAEGDSIVLFGRCTRELGGSEYLSRIHGVVAGRPPVCDLAAERTAIEALLECIESGLVASAHDCSDGGLAVALAECCIANRERRHGAHIDLRSVRELPSRATLFGEAQARFVLSTRAAGAVLKVAAAHGVPALQIGAVTDIDSGFRIQLADGTLSADVRALSAAYHNSIPQIMSRPALASDAEPEPVLAGV